MIVAFMIGFRQESIGDHRLCVYSVSACDIKGYRIKGGKEAYVWDDSGVVFCVTVAIRRNINNKIDIKCRTAVYNCLGIFCDLAVQDIV